MPTKETVQGREMLNRGSKRQKAGKKFVQSEAFLKNLPRPIFQTGGLGFNRWNHKVYSRNMFNSSSICTRDSFSTVRPRNSLLRHEAFDWPQEQSRKHFLKRSFMTKCKLPPANESTSAMLICYSMVSPSCLRSLKFYEFIEKYFLPLLPHHESISLLRSILCPKFVKKSLFSKIREEDSQFLKCPENLKSSVLSCKYLKYLKYLLKGKLLPPEFCKQYFSSYPTSCLSCSHLQFLQNVTKSIQKAPKRLPKLQRNKTHKKSVYRDLCYPTSLYRVHRRGFHNSLFPLAKSDSNKSSACKKVTQICKSTEIKNDECDLSCEEKSDVRHQEKVKCDKSQRNEKARQKPKLEKKILNSECKKSCLPTGKCELPRTVPPPKMEYAKVTCPPPKLAKPKPCPSVEYFKKAVNSLKMKQINRKKQICAPPPLPKAPYAPIVLCPCPPPHKIHPGPCPCYETKMIVNNKRPSIQPCPSKKKYSCPTDVHYCPPQKKPCNLRQESSCEHRKKKKTLTS